MAGKARAYHHGDLAAALIEAAFEMARLDGPDAIALREVTRAVGVTPSAAYRHFADRRALVFAVAARAQAMVATAMEQRMAAQDGESDPARRAYMRLRAIGLAYIDFALEEPNLFQLAFAHREFRSGPAAGPAEGSAAESAAESAEQPPSTGEARPFVLLVGALDELVDQGLLDPAGREHAEWACWSAVHGFADLSTRGPLSAHPPEVLRHLAGYVVERAIDGVVSTGRPH